MRALINYLDVNGLVRQRFVTPRSYHDDDALWVCKASDDGPAFWCIRLQDADTDEVFYVRMMDIKSWADNQPDASESNAYIVVDAGYRFWPEKS